MTITDIRFSTATTEDRRRGLLGYVSVVIGNLLRLDGITVRRSRAGRIILSFPERRDRLGRGHPFMRPIDALARQEIEQRVLHQIRIPQDEPQS